MCSIYDCVCFVYVCLWCICGVIVYHVYSCHFLVILCHSCCQNTCWCFVYGMCVYIFISVTCVCVVFVCMCVLWCAHLFCLRVVCVLYHCCGTVNSTVHPFNHYCVCTLFLATIIIIRRIIFSLNASAFAFINMACVIYCHTTLNCLL